MKKELYEYFGYDVETVSLPGFIRSRSKIKEEAFKELMDMMNKAYPCNKKYRGYHLLAVDGCDLCIFTDRTDYSTYKPDNPNFGHSVYHMNALYDILNHRYLDNIIQPLRKKNEVLAMWTMAERYEGDKAIFIGDRFYATFNNFERLKKTDHKFLIRVKDIHSGTSLLKSFKSLPKKGEYPYTFSNGPLFDQIFMPHDFRHGDIVRISDHQVSNNDLCGIILGFTDEDYEFQKKLSGDYSDVQLWVETPSELTERDRFPHRHVNPIYLQRVKMTKDDKRWACFQNLLDAYERENPKIIK